MEGETRFAVFAGTIAAVCIAGLLWQANRNASIEDANWHRERDHFAVQDHRATLITPTQEAVIMRLAPVLPVPNGYRCIRGQLFRILGSEIDQVTDGTAAKYCR
jgi:hypothetical protein